MYVYLMTINLNQAIYIFFSNNIPQQDHPHNGIIWLKLLSHIPYISFFFQYLRATINM